MPWITVYNSDAKYKANAYKNLKNELINCRNIIEYESSEVDYGIKRIKNTVDDKSGLCGEYLNQYDVACRNYVNKYTYGIKSGLDRFLQSLNTTISQCQSKQSKWEALIYTSVWEPDKEDDNYVGNQIT